MVTNAVAPDKLGGLERYVRELAATLVRKGHDVTTLSKRTALDQPSAETGDDGVRLLRSSTAVIRALYVAGMSWRVVALTVTGRRGRAAAGHAIIRGVVTHKAFVGGTEVARARVDETAMNLR